MRLRPAFTLLELLLVAIVVGIITTLALSYKRTAPVTLVENQARRFAQELRTARASAISRAGTAWIDIEPLAGLDGRGRYRTRVEVDEEEVEATPWIDLEKGVQLRPGAAITGPLGDVVSEFEDPIVIRCDATGLCAMDDAVTLTFYFSHVRAPEIVRAVSISEHGGIRSYQWKNGRWR